MKVAISAQGKNFESPVDLRFGRCNWFIVTDTESGDYQAVSNDQNLNAAQGAGVQSAATVNRHGVEAVLTGHCGPKAFRTLSVAGIKVYTGADGTAADTLEMFKKGMLSEAKEADVEGHWI